MSLLCLEEAVTGIHVTCTQTKFLYNGKIMTNYWQVNKPVYICANSNGYTL